MDWYEIRAGGFYLCRSLRNNDTRVTRVELCSELDAAVLYPDKYRSADHTGEEYR